MPGLLAAALVTLVLVATPASAEPVSSGLTLARPARACGEIPARFLYKIEARGVLCRKARRIARQWAAQCAGIPTGSCLVSALFFCRFRATGYESGAIRCIDERDLYGRSRSPRTVTFVTGV